MGFATSGFVRYSASLLMSVIIVSLYSNVLRVCDSAKGGARGEMKRQKQNIVAVILRNPPTGRTKLVPLWIMGINLK